MYRRTLLHLFVLFALVLALVPQTMPPASAARIPESQTRAVTSNKSAQIPATMPVFQIMPTQVNPDIILNNAGRLSGVGATEVYSGTSRGGLDHYFAFNPQTGNIVDQYNQTGGLFAVNYSRAYTETALTHIPTNEEVCNFLMVRELFPWDQIDPQYLDCGRNPAYTVKQIHLSTVDPSGGQGTNAVIGQLVQVPLAVNIGANTPDYIPMGGPGGHLSLLMAGSARTPGLDDLLPGFQAMASPWFARMLDPQPIGYYPVVPMPVAVDRFKASFPADMQVDAGTPVMVYYAGFPDVPQDALMPTWTFPDATAIISGTVVNLKETTLPGVEGFAPVVNILTPTDGTVIFDNQDVSISFSITGDQEPFSYTVSADSTVLATGVTVSGTLSLDLGPFPALGGRPEGHSLSVTAENSYHQPGEDTVFLGAVQKAYLPITIQAGQRSTSPSRTISTLSPQQPDSTLKIGVEWVMNYHNPDSNLSQTQPDAEGLYTWLWTMGWAKSFDYGNDAAWEKDWRDCSLGGIDCGLGVDHADFAYFSGHGSPTAWYFGVEEDYGGAWGGNSRFQNIRWAAFSSCNTVKAGPYVGPGDPPLTEWFNAFQGAYMILGFNSVMGDIPFGFNFGFNMRNPLHLIWSSMQPTVAEAWVNTAFTMNAGAPSYLYAVGNFDPANYKLPPGSAGPLPPLTGIYQYRWVWWDE